MSTSKQWESAENLVGGQGLRLIAVGVVASLFALVALGACWFPATRAARIDPVQALREE